MSRPRLRHAAARLARNCEGVAAIEFGLTLPLLIGLYFGLVAVGVGFNTDRKVELVARTVADLAGQAVTMNCTEVQNTIGAATAVLAPYSPSGTNIAVALVSVSAGPQATVDWSQARTITSAGGQAAGTLPAGWAAGSTLASIPAGFGTPGTSFVMAKVDKGYTPVVGSSVMGTVGLSHTLLWPARNGAQVTWQGTTSCP